MQKTNYTLTKVISITLGYGLLAASALSALAAQDDGLTQQRRAILAMQESLAKQQVSAQVQSGQQLGAGFFVLPPPAGLGGVTSLPAVPECEPLPPSEVESLVNPAATREGVDADLLRKVMKQESGFRPCAVSPKGAQGLMQLMPATAEQFGVRDPFDASGNVDAGAKLLKQLLTRYDGDIARALAAYNAGPAKVDAASGVPAIPETLDYVRQILSVLPVR